MTKNFYQKSPSIQLFLKSISVGDIDKGECPTCGDKIGSFRDTFLRKNILSQVCVSHVRIMFLDWRKNND